MNPLHSAKTDQWYTPPEIINLVHKTIGAPDLDPASSLEANTKIKATRFITDDALNQDWFPSGIPGSVFVNPPGGKSGNLSIPSLFWETLNGYHDAGLVYESIFLGFSLEFLQVHQGYYQMRPGSLICVPRKRIRFVSPDGNKSPKLPTHGNCIIYTPGLLDHSHLFRQYFGDIGLIIRTLNTHDTP